MLGELTGEDEAHGGLDLAGGDRRLLVVARELGGLGGDLEVVVGGGGGGGKLKEEGELSVFFRRRVFFLPPPRFECERQTAGSH